MTFAEFPAPAKLNLFLHVVGRRADGYHLLQTVFRFVDFGDTVRIRVRDDGVVKRLNDLPGVPAEQDLTVRAARLLQQATGTVLGADLEVVKRLPLGGGLGGGSSDAATVLIALNESWQLGLSRARLMELGLALGADVPVFVFGENAFGEGVGERLTAVPLPAAWYLVLVPQVSVSTAEIFSDSDLTRNTSPVKITAFSIDQGRNDLEPVVRRKYAEVDRAMRWLEGRARARLTGSGGCVFASFDDEREARRVLDARPGGIGGFVARGLEHHPLRDLTR
ncbi:MAG TPA: 4-(cytidine 5'-diphospho)-2-C-methyl-D-erythritol kinase [Pelomicrobium sp.]|nr:4-(cytidine 5'-diphospho)-2-C-methyl-D-erythritol kinase [Pelomicrobium sp.]